MVCWGFIIVECTLEVFLGQVSKATFHCYSISG